MSILQRASKPEAEPFVGTIVGVQGTGKTSLACTFPDVIMLRTQGEKPPMDIPNAQRPSSIEIDSSDMLWETLKALLREEHSYRTVVFDTTTGLDTQFTQEVIAADPNARGLNQSHGGYGNGASMVTAKHMRVRKAAELLRKERGMNIVFLAHAEITDITPPDGDPYSSYTLRLPKKSMSPYLDSVDLVGFLKQQRIVRGAVEAKNDRAGKPGRAITSGDRVLVTYLNPAFASKNRFGITDDIDVIHGENPLAPWVAGAPAPVAEEKPKRTRAPKPAEDLKPDDASDDARDAMENAE